MLNVDNLHFQPSSNFFSFLYSGAYRCVYILPTDDLQRDDKGFAHPERIQKLVKNYSQFVSFPIYTWQEKGYTKEVWLYTPDILILMTLWPYYLSLEMDFLYFY